MKIQKTPSNHSEWITYLQELDATGYNEPEDFNEIEATSSFEVFIKDLKNIIPTLDEQIQLEQDSYTFASIRLPSIIFPGSKYTGTMSLSFFGKLLYIIEPDFKIDNNILKALIECASSHGFSVIPDEISILPCANPIGSMQTWAARFFDWT